MRGRHNWYRLPRNIDSVVEAPFVDIGKAVFYKVGVAVAYVEVDALVSALFKFKVYCTCYDIARSEFCFFVVRLHELGRVLQFKDRAFAS